MKFNVVKVRAIPLKESKTGLGLPYDYVISFKKGIPIDAQDMSLSDALKQVAVGLFAVESKMLSYFYKKGDHTFFEVSFVEKKVHKKFAFITPQGETHGLAISG